jgi:hypothetical protein
MHTAMRVWLRAGLRSICALGVLSIGISQLSAQTASRTDGHQPQPSSKSPTIINVSISKPFFNPSLGQQVGISFSIERPGTLTVTLIDSRRSRVKRLLETSARPGGISLAWDGRNELGVVVADEAYSLKIELDTGKTVEIYFPAAVEPVASSVAGNGYDRSSGILRYELPKPSRVRIIAGVSGDPPGLENVQPPMKVLAEGEPRAAGAVIQQWNGFDETGSIYIPDLAGFTCWVETVELPENAIITVGNRTTGRGLRHALTPSSDGGSHR